MKPIQVWKPNDMHAHLRRDPLLGLMVQHSLHCENVICMTNFPEPADTVPTVLEYALEILAHDPKFLPRVPIMLTNRTTPEIIREAFGCGVRFVKYIPGNTSTNSQGAPSLIRLIQEKRDVLEMIQKLGMFFLGHFELAYDRSGREVHELHREKEAVPYLLDLHQAFPRLKITVEHVSTLEMAVAVMKLPANIAMSITAHHMLLNYQDEIVALINPYHKCRPSLKTVNHVKAIQQVAIQCPKAFFGSDSAPHLLEKKKGDNPAYGIFSSPVAIPLVFELFWSKLGVLAAAAFEEFMSLRGARFYGFDPPLELITLVQEEWTIPDEIDGVVPMCAGRTVGWRIED